MATMQIDDNKASQLMGNSIPGLKSSMAASSKELEARAQAYKDLTELAESEVSEQERLHAIDVKRKLLHSKMLEADRKGHKELKEHYKGLEDGMRKQEQFVIKTMRMEKERRKLDEEHYKLLVERTEYARQGKVFDDSKEKHLATVSALLDKQSDTLKLRYHTERVALKTGKDMVEVHEQITEELSKQAEITGKSAFSEKYNEQMKSMRDGAGKFGFEIDGLTKKQSLFVTGLGAVAGFFTMRKALDLGKQSLMGFAEAADAATEARYRYGTSLSSHEKGVATYLKDSYNMVQLNTDVSLSFARMGMDVDDAKDLIPKMLAKNGTALRYYADNNKGALADMAKSAGAFSRQTGVSVDDAVELQSELMEARQMTSKQADDAMKAVSGSIRGINDSLQDAGFKGALLNVGQMTELITEAAKSADGASFSVEAYAKTLTKAAGAARAFGMSEKSAAQYAKMKMDAASSEDGYAELQRGRQLVSYFDSKYKDVAKTGDKKALMARMMSEDGLAEQDAEYAADMYIKKAKGLPVTMLENRLARNLAGSEINQKAFDANLKAYFDKHGYTKDNPPNMVDLEGDPTFTQLFGEEALSKEARVVVQGAIASWKTDHGVQSAHVNAPVDTKKQDAAIDKAAKETGAKETADNSSTSFTKTMEHAKAIMSNPVVAGLTAGAVGAGGLILGRGALDRVGNILTRAPGAAASEVAEDVAGAGTRAGGGWMKRIGSGALHALKRNKKMAMLMGTAAVAAGGVGLAMSRSSTDAPTNTSDIDSTDPASAKKRARIHDWFALQGLGPDDMARVDLMLAKGIDPGVIADVMKIPTEKVLSSFDPKTGDVTNAALSASPTNPNNATFKAPSLVDDGLNTGINVFADGVMHYGTKRAGTLATKVAPELSAKVASKFAAPVAAKAATGIAAKAGARAIPVLGALLSAAMTYKTTDGPGGRKLAAALGDLGGTALGQAATGGVGGIVGGAAGSFATMKLYDMFAGDSAGANANVTQATQTAPNQQATQVPGAPGSVTAPGPFLTAGGPGLFGNLSSGTGDGTILVPLKLDVRGMANAVQQANNFNYARSSQFSGART